MYRLKTLIKDGNIKKMNQKTKNICKNTFFWVIGLALLPNYTLAASGCQNGNAEDCLKNDPTGSVSKVMQDVTLIINILSASVLVIGTIMIIVAGIMYTTSNADPQKVQNAKRMITNIIVGLVAYFFLWAVLQWLVPGGIFS